MLLPNLVVMAGLADTLSVLSGTTSVLASFVSSSLISSLISAGCICCSSSSHPQLYASSFAMLFIASSLVR
jgi:hypothetical protein